MLSGPGREETALSALTQIDAQPGDVQTWQAELLLPADAGLSGAEILSFFYTGMDYLDNVSDRIVCKNAFQVYQGDLPPLDPPFGFNGRSLPGGEIELTWAPVDVAAGYQLYRRAPGETELTPYLDPLDAADVNYTDAPSIDGLYEYAVASIRHENGESAESGRSETCFVKSDSIAPAVTGRTIPTGR